MSTSPSIPHRSRPPLPFPAPRASRNPLILWHLLSLDAPTVAALWTVFLARASHIHLPTTAVVAMAAAVWLLYAGDRLLDARELDAAQPLARTLEARHRFHHHHRRAFRIGIVAVSALLAWLLPHLAPEAIRLYLIEGSALVAYFLLIHATQSAHRLPKELAVGLFFAAATFIPTIARAPNLRLPLLPSAILFSTVCSLNCLFIYAWEHPRPALSEPHAITRLALQHLHPIALGLLVVAIALCLLPRNGFRQIPAAIALATALLLLLHRFRHYLSATTLRAAADLALLTPLLFLPFR